MRAAGYGLGMVEDRDEQPERERVGHADDGHLEAGQIRLQPSAETSSSSASSRGRARVTDYRTCSLTICA